METTKLSSEGHVVIPKPFRIAYHWEEGQELMVIDTGDGILLKQRMPFPKTTISEVAGCLKYEGTAKTLEDMEDAIKQAATENFSDRR